jgi:hypothetical protein
MARRNRAAKAAEWQERMRRFERSGLSVARFCRGEGVSAPTFYQWRRRLREARDQAAAPSSAGNVAEPEFAAVRIVGGGSVTVTWPGGVQMQLPLGDERLIAAVVATINADTVRARGAAC